ncbi:hypothetical protein BKA70DRAFT_115627 [Coprinopsis sp. MPI-PUGE-AT-0042]|nr:hypothetical protein BKA70DRAFT_115627 [Coprinopsis sp. MPI-PUGE-AT-0042]
MSSGRRRRGKGSGGGHSWPPWRVLKALREQDLCIRNRRSRISRIRFNQSVDESERRKHILCALTQSLYLARSTPISQPRTPQPNYTLTSGGSSSRFGQEIRYDVCTPTVHAQIAHELCRDPITSPPLSGQASKRRNQWHSGNIPVAEEVLDVFTSTALLFSISPTRLNVKHTPVLAMRNSGAG